MLMKWSKGQSIVSLITSLSSDHEYIKLKTLHRRYSVTPIYLYLYRYPKYHEIPAGRCSEARDEPAKEGLVVVEGLGFPASHGGGQLLVVTHLGQGVGREG